MKNTLRGIAFVLLLALCVGGTYRIVSWKDTTGNYLSSVQQLEHTGEGLVDVFFVGSSHCYCSVYPDFLWRDDGIAAFDLAISGQDKWSSYYSLKEAFKTQKPEAVFVECYGLLYDGYLVEGNKYRNLLSFGPTAENMALIERTVGREDRWKYFLRWPIVHTRYHELGKYDFVQYEPSVYGRGANCGWVTGQGPDLGIARSCEGLGALSGENEEWMEDMIALAGEEGFTLVFFVAPMGVSEDDQMVFNAAAAYAAERGVDFVDFGKLSDVIDFDSGTDFEDGNHCNAYGAAKVMEYLRGYLAENFDLKDHRGEAAYELWDLSYRYYRRLEAERVYAGNTGSMDEYLAAAFADEDVVTILNLEGSWEKYSPELCGCLESLGIDAEKYPQGGKWIWRDGEPVFFMSNEDPQAYFLDLSDSDTLRIENRSAKYGESSGANVMIGRTPYGRYTDGLTVLLYDSFRGAVAGIRELE